MGVRTPLPQSRQAPTWLTLQQCIEGTWGRQVGGYGDIILAWGLYLDVHWTVCITSETAHLASREGHICQAAKAVIPENQGVALNNRNITMLGLERGTFYFMTRFCILSFWGLHSHVSYIYLHTVFRTWLHLLIDDCRQMTYLSESPSSNS